jgi:hypothetical protein
MAPTTLTALQARVGLTARYNPGSPEHADALRDYWSARAVMRLKEIVGKSPPFTQAQREAIIAVFDGGDPA